MSDKRSNQEEIDKTNEQESKLIVPDVNEMSKDVKPLNLDVAFEKYSDEEKREILALADSIDLTKIDNIMQYRSDSIS